MWGVDFFGKVRSDVDHAISLVSHREMSFNFAEAFSLEGDARFGASVKLQQET